MGDMAQVNALVRTLVQCEAEISQLGWGAVEALPFEFEWEQVHAELQRFFSPLEIRQMIAEVENV